MRSNFLDLGLGKALARLSDRKSMFLALAGLVNENVDSGWALGLNQAL